MFWCVHLELLPPVEWLEDRMSMFPNDYSKLLTRIDPRYQEAKQHNLERIRELTQIPNGLLSNDAVFGNLLDVCGVKEPGKLLLRDYAWRKLQTRVSFPRHMLEGKEGTRLLHTRMDKEVAVFKQKVRELMGPYADDPEAHTGIVARTENHEDTHDVLLQTTLRVKMPESKEYDAYDVAFHAAVKAYVPGMVDSLFRPRSFLADFAASWAKKKEDGWMNGITTRKAADFVFEVMALETPMQWEEVKAVPGALFELPKVLVRAHTVTAKDLNTAKKECWAEASKIAGVDVKRVEVLARPFLG